MMHFFIVLIVLLILPLKVFCQPVVSQLSANQRTTVDWIDITYDLALVNASSASVSLQVSLDGGESFSVIPEETIKPGSHFGENVLAGSGRSIIWDIGAMEWASSSRSGLRLKLIAEIDSRGEQAKDFIKIPAGSFLMGDAFDETLFAPVIETFVSGYEIARHPVHFSLWQEVGERALELGYNLSTGKGKGPMHPVHSITWFDAVVWCNALSELEGLNPVYRNADNSILRSNTTAPARILWHADGYRLPTEAEWERAARGGLEGKRFPFGDAIGHADANFRSDSFFSYDLSDTRGFHPLFAVGSKPYTSPLGSFAANAYGLFDTAGNVAEWCWDLFSADAYVDGSVNPRGGSSGVDRVFRGGSWQSLAFQVRVSDRAIFSPDMSTDTIGFRLARSSIDRQASSEREVFLVNLFWYSGAAQLANGWRYFDWFKGFKPVGNNWIYHGRHGWLYYVGESTTGLFFWDTAMRRWLWTNQNVYPWMYTYGPNEGWVFFFQGGRPGARWFFRADTGELVFESQLRARQ